MAIAGVATGLPVLLSTDAGGVLFCGGWIVLNVLYVAKAENENSFESVRLAGSKCGRNTSVVSGDVIVASQRT